MSEEEIKEDILFQIDMELYDEFNDTIATMNDHLGDIYSLRDIEEIEKAEKDKEIKLLREAIKKLQALYNKEKEKNKEYEDFYGTPPTFEDSKYIEKDKIREKIEDYESKGYIEIAGAMRELLEERN